MCIAPEDETRTPFSAFKKVIPQFMPPGGARENTDKAWDFLLEKPVKNDRNLPSLVLN